MTAAVFAYSRRGMQTALKVASQLQNEETVLFAPERTAEDPFSPIPMPSKEFYGEHFREDEALIFVGACGIAVRSIAPHVQSKQTDPAVLCVDERGLFVISNVKHSRLRKWKRAWGTGCHHHCHRHQREVFRR